MNAGLWSLNPWKLVAAILIGIIIVLLVVSATRCKRFVEAARERQRALGSQVIQTACGPVEYATLGEGSPVLVVHGVTGGYDQAIYLARAQIGEGFSVIAPSRFGYQGTPLPSDASPAAQADAFVCLLDALGIPKAAVLGVSAGAQSSIQFALRHADRVSALILEVPSAYSPDPPTGVQSVAFPFIVGGILKSDYPVWASVTLDPSAVLGTMGVPMAIQEQLTTEEKAEIVGWLFPYAERVDGAMNDSKIAAKLAPSPVGEISAPTLVISAKDDLWKTYGPAEYTAGRIPNAQFLGFDTGGHLLCGREEEVKSAITAFLKQHSP